MSVDLVRRAQLGDHEAFDALAAAAGHRLYAIASRVLRDTYAAEDAVQEALVRAWRELPRLREPERFDAWLHRLVVNACADQGRHLKRRAREVRQIDTERPDTADGIGSLAARDELERAFLKLDVEHRAALVLVHYVGLTAPEAARVLGVPAGTIYSRLHYGARRMRAILERPSPIAAATEHER